MKHYISGKPSFNVVLKACLLLSCVSIHASASQVSTLTDERATPSSTSVSKGTVHQHNEDKSNTASVLTQSETHQPETNKKKRKKATPAIDLSTLPTEIAKRQPINPLIFLEPDRRNDFYHLIQRGQFNLDVFLYFTQRFKEQAILPATDMLHITNAYNGAAWFVDDMTTGIATLLSERARLNEDNTQLTQENKSLKECEDKLSESYKRIQEENEHLKKEKEDVTQALTKAQSEIKSLQHQIDQLRQSANRKPTFWQWLVGFFSRSTEQDNLTNV